MDFAKAHDSFDTDFRLAALQAKGFPPRFCQMVKTIHAGTTMPFTANGQLFSAMTITSGIRQGCPLAPLLFTMAADRVYDEIHSDQQLQGIALDNNQPEKQFRITGYADGRAIYIKDMHM